MFGRRRSWKRRSATWPSVDRTIRAPPRRRDLRQFERSARHLDHPTADAHGSVAADLKTQAARRSAKTVTRRKAKRGHRANPRRARGGRAILETSEDPDASKVAAHLRTCRDAGDFDDLVGRRARWRVYFGGRVDRRASRCVTERLAAPPVGSHSPLVESIATSLRFTSPGPSRAPGGRRASD